MMQRLIWILFFSLFTTVANAEKERSLELTFTDEGPCKSFSIGFSVSSDHTEKGDRHGLVNQRNHGKVGECFFDKERRFYMFTGALTNSQWGPTLLHGYGVRFRTPQVWRLSAEAGYETALTYYEKGCPQGIYASLCRPNRGAYIAPLPMLYVGANMELPSMRQVLSPFLSYEDQQGLHSILQVPMGDLTIGRRTLGYPFFRNKEKIYLYTVTWTYRFK